MAPDAARVSPPPSPQPVQVATPSQPLLFFLLLICHLDHILFFHLHLLSPPPPLHQHQFLIPTVFLSRSLLSTLHAPLRRQYLACDRSQHRSSQLCEGWQQWRRCRRCRRRLLLLLIHHQLLNFHPLLFLTITSHLLWYGGVCFDTTRDFSLDESSNKEVWQDGRSLPSLAGAPPPSALPSVRAWLTAVSRWSCAAVTIAQACLCRSIWYS